MNAVSAGPGFDVVTFGETMVLFAPGERDRLEFATSRIFYYRRNSAAAQVILTAGDKGAWYADGKKRGFCPCFPATEIDPVGAGDVQRSAFNVRRSTFGRAWAQSGHG
jgi:sugar/nucleoside kinase (ribokinase family)